VKRSDVMKKYSKTVDPNTSPANIERPRDPEWINPKGDTADAGDTDDANNEELESLKKTDDNNLKEHPEEVNGDTKDR